MITVPTNSQQFLQPNLQGILQFLQRNLQLLRNTTGIEAHEARLGARTSDLSATDPI